MKKLMIAAAAAAMIGGAFADTLVYDFTANLKTTTGKASKQITSTWNLGTDGAGAFWYDDAEFTDLPDTVKTIKTVKKSTVPAFTTDKKGFLVAPDAATYDQCVAALAQLADDYDQKSAGVWCQTVKTTDSGCYRVAGTQKLKETLYIDDCCADGVFVDEDGDAVLNNVVFQRFGALQGAKANKVEGWFDVANGWVPAQDVGLVAAGQGTFKDKLYKDSFGDYVAGVSSLSGNIVGTLPPPDCENCCSIAEDAVAFACDDDTADETLYTAAYGTYTLKFNSSKTKKFNN